MLPGAGADRAGARRARRPERQAHAHRGAGDQGGPRHRQGRARYLRSHGHAGRRQARPAARHAEEDRRHARRARARQGARRRFSARPKSSPPSSRAARSLDQSAAREDRGHVARRRGHARSRARARRDRPATSEAAAEEAGDDVAAAASHASRDGRVHRQPREGQRSRHPARRPPGRLRGRSSRPSRSCAASPRAC